MWYVYILQCNDGSLYTGITLDVDRRVNEHNTSKKGAKYCKNKRPVVLKKTLEFETRSLAAKEEYRIKQLTRKEKLKLL